MKCDNTCPECRTHISTYRHLKEDSRFNDLVQGCVKVLKLLQNEKSRNQKKNTRIFDAKSDCNKDDNSIVSQTASFVTAFEGSDSEFFINEDQDDELTHVNVGVTKFSAMNSVAREIQQNFGLSTHGSNDTTSAETAKKSTGSINMITSKDDCNVRTVTRLQSRKRKDSNDEIHQLLKKSTTRTKNKADAKRHKRRKTINKTILWNPMSTVSSHEASIVIDLLPDSPTPSPTRTYEIAKVTPTNGVVRSRRSMIDGYGDQSESESEFEISDIESTCSFDEHEIENTKNSFESKDKVQKSWKKKPKKFPHLVVIVGGAEYKPVGWNVTSFEQRMKELMVFKAKHGHCEVHHFTEEDFSFVRWCARMRSNYNAYNRGDVKNSRGMTEERIRRLNEIGFAWTIHAPNTKTFEERIEELLKFKAKFGHTIVPTRHDDNHSLGMWCDALRVAYRKYQAGKKAHNSIDEEKIRRLDEIGFAWDVRVGGINAFTFDEYFDCLLDFKRKFGHCEVPTTFEDENLKRWVRHMRDERKWYMAGKKTSRIDGEKIKRLDEIGFVWECKRRNATTFDERIQALKAFKEEYGHTRVPCYYKDDPSFGIWCSRMRGGLRSYLEGRGFKYYLNEERIRIIQEIGIEPSPPNLRKY